MELEISPVIALIAYIAGFIISVSGAMAIVTKWFKKQVKAVVKEVVDESMCTKNAEFNEAIKELTDKINSFIDEHTEDHKVIKEALMNMAQDRISQAHDYYMRKGQISEMSLYFIEKLFASYKNLNGNGHADGLMEDLRQLYKNQFKKQNGDKQ